VAPHERIAAAALGPIAHTVAVEMDGAKFPLGHGSLVIAAITSCTNTSNPSVLIAAGLLAKKAVERGLTVKPWVKTSLAPGSKVVTAYLKRAGLTTYLDQLRFNLVGYGCTTCIGNSGPVAEPIAGAVKTGNLVASAILSGNRNFEGRINPGRAFSITWPRRRWWWPTRSPARWISIPTSSRSRAIPRAMRSFCATSGRARRRSPPRWPVAVDSAMFKAEYGSVVRGRRSLARAQDSGRRPVSLGGKIVVCEGPAVLRRRRSNARAGKRYQGARVLAMLGDSVTTDHISPAGSIAAEGPAGRYLVANGVSPHDFNSYGARRGNHEVMVRGTFANIRLKTCWCPASRAASRRICRMARPRRSSRLPSDTGKRACR